MEPDKILESGDDATGAWSLVVPLPWDVLELLGIGAVVEFMFIPTVSIDLSLIGYGHSYHGLIVDIIARSLSVLRHEYAQKNVDDVDEMTEQTH